MKLHSEDFYSYLLQYLLVLASIFPGLVVVCALLRYPEKTRHYSLSPVCGGAVIGLYGAIRSDPIEFTVVAGGSALGSVDGIYMGYKLFVHDLVANVLGGTHLQP